MQVWVTIYIGSMPFHRAQKTLDFQGPNSLSLALVMDLHASKILRTGPVFSPEADESSSEAKIGVGVGLRSALFCVLISLETDFSPIWNFCGFSLYIWNLSAHIFRRFYGHLPQVYPKYTWGIPQGGAFSYF